MKSKLSSLVGTADAFVPGHITGIFRIHDDHEDILYRGSTGAGFSIQAGTKTTVALFENNRVDIKTTYNGIKIEAPVTETVIRRLTDLHDIKLKAEVAHVSELPIGVGFGASGAGALGTALAASTILEDNLDTIKAAQIAHYAEVKNHAGLGDVIAQFSGGVEIRTHPGAPGIGETIPLSYPSDTIVVLAGATGLETKEVLTNPTKRTNINQFAGSLLKELRRGTPSLENLVKSSRTFSKSIGLMTPRISNALDEIDQQSLGMSSMVMLGDSLFCLCQQDEKDQVSEILLKGWKPNELLVTKISERGGRVIS